MKIHLLNGQKLKFLENKIVFKKSKTKFQRKALIKLNNFFKTESRGLLFLPCGTGKTLIGFWLSEYLKARRNIILVPNLALITQTLKVWSNELIARGKDPKWLIVCSDKDVNINSDPFVISAKELPFETTTDERIIEQFLNQNTKIFLLSRHTIVLSKYRTLLKKITFRLIMEFLMKHIELLEQKINCFQD